MPYQDWRCFQLKKRCNALQYGEPSVKDMNTRLTVMHGVFEIPELAALAASCRRCSDL